MFGEKLLYDCKDSWYNLKTKQYRILSCYVVYFGEKASNSIFFYLVVLVIDGSVNFFSFLFIIYIHNLFSVFVLCVNLMSIVILHMVLYVTFITLRSLAL